MLDTVQQFAQKYLTKQTDIYAQFGKKLDEDVPVWQLCESSKRYVESFELFADSHDE